MATSPSQITVTFPWNEPSPEWQRMQPLMDKDGEGVTCPFLNSRNAHFFVKVIS
jgi:hypothetical protein